LASFVYRDLISPELHKPIWQTDDRRRAIRAELATDGKAPHHAEAERSVLTAGNNFNAPRVLLMGVLLTGFYRPMMKQTSIIAAALALAVASSTAMAETPKRSVVDKATKSPRHSKPDPNSYEERLRQYEKDKRDGWYKEDRALFPWRNQKAES
jgi:hypothetical protein